MIRPSRSASRDDPVGELAHRRPRRRRRPSSRRAAPSAPIGVFSSWLTLATKSRRTLSLAPGLGDVADEARPRRRSSPSRSERLRPQRRAPRGGGPKSWSSRSPLWPVPGPVEQLVDLLLGEGVAVAAVAEPLGRPRCAARSVPSASTTIDRVAARRAQRLGEAGSRLGRAASARVAAGEPVVERRAVPRRRSMPGARGSSEPTGDVALGARVRRVGEDLLGRVELDEARRCGSPSSRDLGGEERGHVRRRGRPAACCG